MPELKQMTVPAEKIALGDIIWEHKGEVCDKSVKTKYAYFDLSSGGVVWDVRYPIGTEVVIERMSETEQEAAAKQLRRTLMSLDNKERSARSQLENARAKMIKNMQAGERPSSWDWMDIPLAQARVDLWDSVAHLHRVRAQGDNPATRVEAVRRVREVQMKKELSYFSATSRSTGVISNLFEDIKRQALSEWMRELEWVLWEN